MLFVLAHMIPQEEVLSVAISEGEGGSKVADLEGKGAGGGDQRKKESK